MNSTERALLIDESQCGSVRHDCGMAGHRVRRVLVVAVLLLIPSCGMILGQQTSPSNAGLGTRPVSTPDPEMDLGMTGSIHDPVFQERRLRELIAAQHKAMVSDTDKLLKLVTELNAEVDNTTPAALTPDQLRMVAEIEKLAHSVKDKMRNSAQGAQMFLDSRPPIMASPSRH